MNDSEKKDLKDKQIKLMEKRERLEALQTQRSNKLECFHCLERRMQALDEEADIIRWKLEGGSDDT